MNKRFLVFAILINTVPLYAVQKQISIADFGLEPDKGTDAVPYVKKAIEYCRKNPGTTLCFPKGRYDFYPEDGIDNGQDIMNRPATVGIHIDKVRKMIFDGGGSEFIYHGKMQVAAVDSCSDVELRNFTVDWDRPFISQGEIVGSGQNFLDLKVDKKNYPYVIENGNLFFLGEGWKLPVITMYSTLYDKETKEIAYNTWDATLGPVFETTAEELQDGIIRFHGAPSVKPENGTIVALFHVRYFATGVGISRSKNIVLQDIALYHSLSNGFLGYRTENITMNNASVKVNDAKGRYFSSVADASHFSECKGTIKVLNCSHTGQADDFINVHGTSVRIVDVPDRYTVEVASSGKGSGGSVSVGDDYWFIDVNTAQRGEIGTVKKKEPKYENNRLTGYLVTFAKPVPAAIKGGDFLECKTWTPRLEIRNCRILKRHRARGILFTTPKEVIIEDNYFRTAGTAILIEGDFDYWYESGANNNVKVRNNVFDNCLTSGNKHGSRSEWGEAVITITPSYIPQDTVAEPYHRNIKIYNNSFRVFDAPLIRAASVKSLYFTGNKIEKTYDYKPYTWQKSAFLLDGCRDVRIQNNIFDKHYENREIRIEHMTNTDVKQDKKSMFIVKPVGMTNTRMQWD